jgi:glycosyltransferase involved in cell wall biosynthesis
MKISVIIPGRNENEEIEATYNSFLENGCDEIIIYDDGSDTPLPVLAKAKNIRHEKTLGPSVCRNLGGKRATGDVLIFSDAHVRVEGIRNLCEFVYKEGIVGIPTMQSLYGSKDIRGYCRDFILKGNSNEMIGFSMNNAKPKVNRYAYSFGNWGGMFIMPKYVFDAIDGWIDHRYWGYNDPSLFAKCFFCNIDVVLDMDTFYKHKNKVKLGFGYPVTGKQPILNLFHSYFVIFDNSTFENYWLPLLKKEHAGTFDEAMEFLSRPEIVEEKNRFKKLKKQPDDNFFKVFLKQENNRSQYQLKNFL